MDRVPDYCSNIDSIGTFNMARALEPFQSIVALHKHYPAESLIDFFKTNKTENALARCWCCAAGLRRRYRSTLPTAGVLSSAKPNTS